LARAYNPQRATSVNFKFFLANAKCFNAKMGLFLFAKIQQIGKNNVAFNLKEVATLLNYTVKHILLAYNECLDCGWFTEVERVGYWVNILPKKIG
jgi:hypothetical protein